MSCVEPGCPGTYEDDGWCNVCGTKAPATAPAVAASATVPASTPSAASAPSFASAPSAPTGTRPTGTTKTSMAAGRLGAGLVTIPAATVPDPASIVLADPQIPEDKRFCAHCNEPVGRSRDGRPGRTEGFCPKDGTPFSFTPKLAAGDLLEHNYDVVGCLAHGGLGWIYLARDIKVHNRWVVLKGMLHGGDPEALAVAQAELEFLAAFDHPNIVKVFNFVEHAGDGYIVMEYVGGPSLRDLLRSRRDGNGGRANPLPVDHAIAYVLEILPALGYLHDRGVLYCDFKPDNVIQNGTALKLIDMGAVYRADDTSSPIYGTVGYQAPEIARTGPTVASDLYTVGRTLAVLCTDFRGFQSTYRDMLPQPDDVPQYRELDSLYRFLLRATAADPDERFQSSGEMADQLAGLLREVVATRTGDAAPGVSANFTTEIRGSLAEPDWRTLPVPLVDLDDPAAPYLTTLSALDAEALIDALERAPEQTAEVQLQKVRALLDAGRTDDAAALMGGIEAAGSRDWRLWWYRGLADLAAGNPAAAQPTFVGVYQLLPGDLAPKLALALVAELGGDLDAACRWYDIVARTDHWYLTASFGLARCRLAAGDPAGATAAYGRVPATSAAHVDAQLAAARVTLGHATKVEDALDAARIVDRLALDGARRDQLTAEVLEAALPLLGTNGHLDESIALLGHELTEPGLRLGLETTYRALARRAGTTEERIELVDRANRVRPRTLT